MKVAVLGTGGVGRAHAEALVSLGHDVRFGARASTTTAPADDAIAVVPFADAVTGADLVINAVNGSVAREVVAGLADALAGKVLLDLTNPLDFSPGHLQLSVCNTDSLGEQIQRAAPAAFVVKTMCTTNVGVQIDPGSLADGEHHMFVAGNDTAAKDAAVELLRSYGWRHVIDLGDITAARGLEMMMPMWLLLSQTLGTARVNYRIVTDSD